MTRFVTLLALLMLAASPAFAAGKESAYDRVIRTGTLRCGYGVFPPMILKDPNSGEINGIFADVMRAVGKAADLKIEFVEEVDWGAIPAALQAGRIDAMCASMWETARRGKFVAFTDPVFYSTMRAFARADDKRFDNNPAALNEPAVKLSVNDGDASLEIADRDFPRAQRVYKTQMAGEDFLLMNVASGKADATFTAPSIVTAFSKTNPGKLREIPMDKPLSVYANVIGVDIHEHELRSLLNSAIAELRYNGTIAKIFDKYGPEAKKEFPLSPP
jgi:polar amino acid transport system substrate-binding protein